MLHGWKEFSVLVKRFAAFTFTLRGYSGGKDKTRTTGDPKRVAACCQRFENSWKLHDARMQSEFEFGEPLLAEFPSRDTSHSCPGCC